MGDEGAKQESPTVEFTAFKIDKTYQSLYEAGKIISHAFVTYLLLIAFAMLLLFSGGIENAVLVPYLQLAINKSSAAIVILILSWGALLWLTSTYTYYMGRYYDLEKLIKARYGVDLEDTEYLHYPSPMITFISSLGDSEMSDRRENLIGYSIGFLSILVFFIIPGCLAIWPIVRLNIVLAYKIILGVVVVWGWIIAALPLVKAWEHSKGQFDKGLKSHDASGA